MADLLTNALHSTAAFIRPAFTSAVRTLELPQASLGLDAGCGTGNVWPVLAEVIGVDTRLIAVDPSEHCVAEAERRVHTSGFKKPVSLRHEHLETYLAQTEAATLDWIWTADVLWPNYFDDVAAVVTACRRVLKPGGTFAFFTANYYRSVFLPGYSRLEGLIGLASQKAWQVDFEGNPNYYENALAWFLAAGLVEVQLSVHPASYTAAHLEDPGLRGYLEHVVFPDYAKAVEQFGYEVGMTDADKLLWLTLSDPTSADYLLRRPGYYCYHPGLMVAGRVPV